MQETFLCRFSLVKPLLIVIGSGFYILDIMSNILYSVY